MAQAKQRRVSLPSDIDAKIQALKEKREKMLDQRGRRYARIADQAGLIEVQISDEDLLREFKGIADRFRAKGPGKSEPVAQAEQPPQRAHAAE